ncbi:hypothetical protein K4K53_011933 [Colletotrichum sp. SAR 10_77]|nr:hypothetical protein K4K53_011933 [Colletotrichum sp. SAR 10_77]
MNDSRNIEDLLQTGYFTTTRAKTPKPVVSASDDEPPSRGDAEQHPIIMEVHEYNPERRFVIIPKSDSEGGDGDSSSDDAKSRSSGGSRSAKTRLNGDYGANTSRKYYAPRVDDPDTAKRPGIEKRKSRQDLPKIETDIKEEEPRVRRHERTKSGTRAEQKADYFSAQYDKRQPNETLLSPKVIKHATGGREKVYYDYSQAGRNGVPRPQRSYSNLADQRRFDDNYGRQSSSNPPPARRSNTNFDSPKEPRQSSGDRVPETPRHQRERIVPRGERPEKKDPTTPSRAPAEIVNPSPRVSTKSFGEDLPPPPRVSATFPIIKDPRESGDVREKPTTPYPEDDILPSTSRLSTREPEPVANVASKVTSSSPCPGDRRVTRVWYSLKNPYTQTTMPDFTVCHECAKTVEGLLPNLLGVFVTLHPSAQPTRSTCAMHYNPDRKRFVMYFDALETTSDVALATAQPPNIAKLVSDIESLSVFTECCKDNPVFDQNWHIMQYLPQFTVCGDCFDEVVAPQLKDGNVIARNFYVKPQRLEDATCQLYSARMRAVFDKACRRNDPKYLEVKVLERQKMFVETYKRLSKLEQERSLWAREESKKLLQEWEKWE